jgi:hypothetical protein
MIFFNHQTYFQEYFICDWWFNVDCSRSENLYSLNDNLDGAASNQQPSYTAPLNNYGSGTWGRCYDHNFRRQKLRFSQTPML